MSWTDSVLGDPDIGNGSFLVTRASPPQFFDGVEFAQPSTTFQTGIASLQPASGRQLRVLPEGLRADHVAALLTTADLRVEPVPDVVRVLGTEHPSLGSFAGRWRVYQVQTLAAHGSGHTLAYLARIL